jgi:hypothetical protein
MDELSDLQHWQVRQRRASQRVDSGQYGYTEPQAEEGGLSAASIDDELGLQERESN